MNHQLKVSKSIEINASPKQIWDALINPIKIREYLFGTEAISDWQVGSTIVFQGKYEGQAYKDKGNVIQVIPNELIQYDYWSGFSGLEDLPENYSKVSYRISAINSNTSLFTWQQQGFASQENQQHSEKGLDSLLERIKKVVEESK